MTRLSRFIKTVVGLFLPWIQDVLEPNQSQASSLFHSARLIYVHFKAIKSSSLFLVHVSFSLHAVSFILPSGTVSLNC